VISPNCLETKFIYRSSNILYGGISGAETAYYSGTPTLLFRNTNVQPRVVLCPLLFLIFYLAIICSVRLRILASDYPFGTFKRFLHRKDVRFVIASICLWEDSCLIYVICLWEDSCLIYVICLWEDSCLIYVICLWEDSCLIYVICLWEDSCLIYVICLWENSCLIYVICLWEDSCLIYVICVFLCILVSGTYCVVFFCFVRLMSCVLNAASFSGFSILGCTFGFL